MNKNAEVKFGGRNNERFNNPLADTKIPREQDKSIDEAGGKSN
ncbi:MAG TPA: hypothetical protein VJ372_11255 [Pyrinomonadaceae bacterium]|jgi:hypothetical protein|nr:hypothetical protein [Pyrinomonadaceae bacterium]